MKEPTLNLLCTRPRKPASYASMAIVRTTRYGLELPPETAPVVCPRNSRNSRAPATKNKPLSLNRNESPPQIPARNSQPCLGASTYRSNAASPKVAKNKLYQYGKAAG